MQSCLRSIKLALKRYRNIAGLTDTSCTMGTTESTIQIAKLHLRGYLQVQAPKGVTMRQDYWSLLLTEWDVDTLKHFYKVPVHQRTRCGEQTGRTRDLCALISMQLEMWWDSSQECCHEGLHDDQERKTRKAWW